ncbi:hypothetical protein BDZ45DRAFT_208775 [Acephala macrosclerotiorum]|nr:hypothetical protein BDZ45DRAFT_208775 [Acephala macrosclerotiorum]
MRFTTLSILPLPLLVFTHPVIVEHKIVDILPDRPTIHHVDSPPNLPRCITINTPNVGLRRSLSQAETSMTKTPHTTEPHRPSNTNIPPKRTLFARALSILQVFTTHTTSPHSPQDQPVYPTTQIPKPAVVHRTLSKRDSVTISISTTLNNTTVCQSANTAKFEVVNNAKNTNIAMGDSSNHTAGFHSFGDKNMLNSTGSNTGGWNTKNRDSKLTTEWGHKDKRGKGREMREKGKEERELIGWKGWFESVWQGGDYGRWEMPWRAPGPGTAKEGKVDGTKWSGGVTATKSSPAAEETGFQGLEEGVESSSTESAKSVDETATGSQGSKWGHHKTYTRTVTMGPSETPEPEGPKGNETWTKVAVPTKGPRPFRPGGNETHPHGPSLTGHPWPRPKPGNHTDRGLVVGTLRKTGGDEKRDTVNLNIVGGSSNSTLTQSGNDNTIEVYVAGNGDNVVNITVVWEGVGTEMQESGNGNVVRVYVGDSRGVHMRNSNLMIVGGEEL